MKTVMVFDVPATAGGALSILEQYYKSAAGDRNNNYIFVISTPNLHFTDTVRILKYPWVKKSWLHRLWFDQIVAPKLVRRFTPDEILSLQNVTIPRVSVPQTIYLHQSLPFVNIKFKLIKAPKLWIYQNIIGKIIVHSLKRADKIIVQTEWMKRACKNKAKIDPAKVTVIPPKPDLSGITPYKRGKGGLFFYPADGYSYKNHRVIYDAVCLLAEKKLSKFKIVFTLNGDENANIKNIYKNCKNKNLPLEFVGKLTRKEVYDYYARSILLFPSYIETIGLPLLEAREHGCPIIVSDCAFSHEILDGYENAGFFDPFDSRALSKLIEKAL